MSNYGKGNRLILVLEQIRNLTPYTLTKKKEKQTNLNSQKKLNTIKKIVIATSITKNKIQLQEFPHQTSHDHEHY